MAGRLTSRGWANKRLIREFLITAIKVGAAAAEPLLPASSMQLLEVLDVADITVEQPLNTASTL